MKDTPCWHDAVNSYGLLNRLRVLLACPASNWCANAEPMNFYMADSFEKSLGKLSGAEQKAAKLAAMDLQLDRKKPGLQCHRLTNIKE